MAIASGWDKPVLSVVEGFSEPFWRCWLCFFSHSLLYREIVWRFNLLAL